MSSLRANYPLNIVDQPRDFREMLDKTVARYPDKISFLEKNEAGLFAGITFKEFRLQVEQLSEGLFELGLKRRDKVAIMGNNCRKWAISYYAITSVDMIAVPIDRELKPIEVENIADKAGISAAIFDGKFRDVFLNIKKGLSSLHTLIAFDKDEHIKHDVSQVGQQGREALNKNFRRYAETVCDPDLVTSLIFTSGTTGVPKGVMLSQKNIITNIVQMLQLHKIEPADVFLSVLPLHHAYECTCGFLCQVHVGSTIAYARNLKTISENLAEVKTTIMLGVPLLFETFYRRINTSAFSGFTGKLKYAVASGTCMFFRRFLGIDFRRKVFKQLHDKFGGNLKRFISGGAALKPEIGKFFDSLGIQTVQGYGITECGPLLAVNRDQYDRHGSVGFVAPGVNVKIFDKNIEGVGEIGVKGDNIMLGYYEEPGLTDEVYEDGYFLTGDYGYFDKDKFLFITGRKKNIIVTKNGKNVYPEEIEFLYSSSRIISDIVVVAGKDPRSGDETIAAVVYPNLEYAAEILGVTESEVFERQPDIVASIREEIRENNRLLSHMKRIHFFSLKHEEMEKTTKKTIKRFKIHTDAPLISVY